MRLVLSMPANVEPEAVRDAVREFSQKTFGANYEYVFALHTDEMHPHCHITVKCLGFDARRLNPRKADLQEWRENFADAMLAQGYDAEATPRRSRGVVRKAQKSVVRRVEQGDKTHQPRIAKVTAARTKEAAAELVAEANGQAPKRSTWDAAIKARQAEVRGAWNAAAKALAETGRPEDRELSEQIKGFVGRMPRSETLQQLTKQALLQRFSRPRERAQEPDSGGPGAARPAGPEKGPEA